MRFNNAGTDVPRRLRLHGVVNFDDYALIDAAFNTHWPLLRALQYLENTATGRPDGQRHLCNRRRALRRVWCPYASAFINSVPEPSCALSLGGLAALTAANVGVANRDNLTLSR